MLLNAVASLFVAFGKAMLLKRYCHSARDERVDASVGGNKNELLDLGSPKLAHAFILMSSITTPKMVSLTTSSRGKIDIL